MKILVIGDVVSKSGQDTLNKYLAKRSKNYDFIIVNGENAHKGFGITPSIANDMFYNGVDVITLGNHSFDNKEIYNYLENENRIIRPYNLSKYAYGKGYTIIEKNNKKIAVINLQGKVYMNTTSICPFISIDNLIDKLKNNVDIIIVDFHAEVTSEKVAMGWNLAGKVSLIYGTHTHVQTADEKILLNSTAYITDVGMTGSHDGVIGMNKKEVLYRFKTGLKAKYVACDTGNKINGIEVEIDDTTNKAIKINRINIFYEEI